MGYEAKKNHACARSYIRMMVKLFRIFLVLAATVLLASNGNAAKREWPNTCQLILESKLIIRGHVATIEKGLPSSAVDLQASIKTALVQIEETIKGTYSDKFIKVVAGPITLGDRIELLQNREYVLMLTPFRSPQGRVHQNLYIPARHGYGSSIASPGQSDDKGGGWPKLLRFYYHRNADGRWVTKDFQSVEEYTGEVRRIMAIQKGDTASSSSCDYLNPAPR